MQRPSHPGLPLPPRAEGLEARLAPLTVSAAQPCGDPEGGDTPLSRPLEREGLAGSDHPGSKRDERGRRAAAARGTERRGNPSGRVASSKPAPFGRSTGGARPRLAVAPPAAPAAAVSWAAASQHGAGGSGGGRGARGRVGRMEILMTVRRLASICTMVRAATSRTSLLPGPGGRWGLHRRGVPLPAPAAGAATPAPRRGAEEGPAAAGRNENLSK